MIPNLKSKLTFELLADLIVIFVFFVKQTMNLNQVIHKLPWKN